MNDKLREALVIANALQNAITEELAASKQEPTTCGYCTYEESDGSLIEQCQACKDKDSKQEPLEKLTRLTEEMGPYPWQEPQAQAEPEFVAEYVEDETYGHRRWRWRTLPNPEVGDKLITLQSHREAMAVVFSQRDDAARSLRIAIEECGKRNTAIAKKDAAEAVDWSDSDVRGSIVNMWNAMVAKLREKNAVQPAREWVGLTGQEVIHCMAAAKCFGTVKMSIERGPYDIDTPTKAADDFVLAVEAKLREKNAGIAFDAEWLARREQAAYEAGKNAGLPAAVPDAADDHPLMHSKPANPQAPDMEASE